MLEAGDLTRAAAEIEAALRCSRIQGVDVLIDTLESCLAYAIHAASTLDRCNGSELVSHPAEVVLSSRKTRHSILVVDDDPIFLKLFLDTFPDYDLLTAGDGETALQLATLNHPELILLDVNMPGIDGFEVCRRLKSQSSTSDIPVFFVTGTGDVEAETKGLTLGAVDYLTKPMTPAVMRARVDNQVKLKRAQVDLMRILAKKYLDDMVDELERSAAQDRIRELQLQMKDDFLAHVSHELRSPLASIYSFITLVADGIAGQTTPQQNEYLGIALMNVEQLQSMIEDLLESTRIRTGKLSIALEDVSVIDVVKYVVQSLREVAKAKSISLSFRVSDNLAAAHADPTRMRQSLTILVDNALKFTPGGGTVIVSVRVFEQDSRYLLVEVADTGCGISADMTESVFDRLCQVDKAQQGLGAQVGLGLGLHIAKELVERQGGKIWVDSVLGQGSKFCFTVPMVIADTKRLTAEAA